MRPVVRALVALAVLGLVQAAGLVTLVSGAHAQSTNVVVLGLTSIEGDDTFATNLSGALRTAASQVRGWTVSDRDVPLSQLELATGCDATELACVQQIANTVGAQRLVYGTIQRSDAGGGRFDFAISIHLYDTATNSIIRSLDERLPSSRTDIDDLREPARRYATSLAEGAGTSGTGAGVGLPPEGHEIGEGSGGEQSGSGGEQSGSGSGGEQTPPSSGGDDLGRLNWPAFALLVVAVGSAVGWIVTGLDAMSARDTLDSYRRGGLTGGVQPMPGSGTDLAICHSLDNNGLDAAQRANVQGACDAQTSEILQFVFMGVTAVAGGIGVGLLAANGVMSPAPDQDHVRLRLMPSITSQSAYLGVGVDF